MQAEPEEIALMPPTAVTERRDATRRVRPPHRTAALRARRRVLTTAIHTAVVVAFNLFVARQCRLHVRRDARPVLQPGATVVFAHKRDLDVPVLVTAVFD